MCLGVSFQEDWDYPIHMVKFACKGAVHDKTGQTPFVLNHERQLPAPMDRAVGDDVHAANDFVGAMCETIEVAECNMVKAQQRQKSLAVSRRRVFRPGLARRCY